jgi:hypothetical protein
VANEQLGRASLGADAAYCAVTGTAILAAVRPISRWTGLPAPAVAGVGVVASAWSGFVARSASQDNWQSGIRAVASTNAVAAGVLAVVAGRQSRRGMRLTLGAMAVEIGAFAAVQIASLVLPPNEGEDEPVG